MKFKYRAKTKDGEDQTGFVEASDRDAAASVLSSHELFILALEPAERVRWYDRLASYFGGVKRKDMAILMRQFATLLEARLPLKGALRMIYEQTSQPVLKEAVVQVSEDVDAGLSLSQAMDRQGTIFSRFFVSMVRAAEVTGNLDEAVGYLAEYSEKEDEFISKATAALIYPSLVIGLFIIVAFVMVAFVFPQIEPIFSQSGVKLPFLSAALLGVGMFLGRWWFFLLLGIVALVAMAMSYLRTPEGRAFSDDLKVRLPLLSKVYLPVILARVSSATALLLRGGIPVAQSIEIVSTIIDNVLYRELFRDIAESVRQGEPLSKAFAKYPEYLPPVVSQMLVVGEATGRVDQVFTRLTNLFSREADETIRNVTDLIQPILMVGVGLLVGLLFASILVPLYQLTSTIQL